MHNTYKNHHKSFHLKHTINRRNKHKMTKKPWAKTIQTMIPNYLVKILYPNPKMCPQAKITHSFHQSKVQHNPLTSTWELNFGSIISNNIFLIMWHMSCIIHWLTLLSLLWLEEGGRSLDQKGINICSVRVLNFRENLDFGPRS